MVLDGGLRFENKLDRTDLVLWFKMESNKDLTITVEPQN